MSLTRLNMAHALVGASSEIKKLKKKEYNYVQLLYLWDFVSISAKYSTI